MLNIILNIIGIILIIYAIYTIRVFFLKDKYVLKDFDSIEENIDEYSRSNNEEFPTFEDLIEFKHEEVNKDSNEQLKIQSNNKFNKLKTKSLNGKNVNKITSDYDTTKRQIDPTYKKIMELLEIGLSKEEIAKRLNKGIREIEIIIKIHCK